MEGESIKANTSLIIDRTLPSSDMNEPKRVTILEMTIQNLDTVVFDENLNESQISRNISLSNINKVFFKKGIANVTISFNQVQEMHFEDLRDTPGSFIFGPSSDTSSNSTNPDDEPKPSKTVLNKTLTILLHVGIGTFLGVINSVAIFYIFVIIATKTGEGLSFKFWKRFRFLKLKQPIRKKSKAEKNKKKKEKIVKEE